MRRPSRDKVQRSKKKETIRPHIGDYYIRQGLAPALCDPANKPGGTLNISLAGAHSGAERIWNMAHIAHPFTRLPRQPFAPRVVADSIYSDTAAEKGRSEGSGFPCIMPAACSRLVRSALGVPLRQALNARPIYSATPPPPRSSTTRKVWGGSCSPDKAVSCSSRSAGAYNRAGIWTYLTMRNGGEAHVYIPLCILDGVVNLSLRVLWVSIPRAPPCLSTFNVVCIGVSPPQRAFKDCF